MAEVIPFPKPSDPLPELEVWRCNHCGCTLFYVCRAGIECSKCQTWQVFD